MNELGNGSMIRDHRKLLRLFIRCLKDNKEFQALAKIDRYLRILMGDKVFKSIDLVPVLERMQETIKSWPEEEPQKPVTVNGFLGLMAAHAPTPKETWIEIIRTSLDLIFEQRYGYPQGTTKGMTAEQMRLALEHAMEHDDRLKPSVWKITE
jgi:hypothetical protein